MNIKAQIAMVLNLDKCLGCHACSVACKNAWTTSKGREYMWFNNVESKPGIGYPREWENQERYRGGWTVEKDRPVLRSGGKLEKYLHIFSAPRAPLIDEYAEPWTYDYDALFASPSGRHQPVARAVSAVTGRPMDPQWGPNWEDDLAGAPETAPGDPNFSGLEASVYLQFKKVFMLHLPRLCEHCLHPACVASCPSGALYKREEDGIVLVDQSRCRGWRHCVSNCPYKKVYFNWKEHRSEKCLLCYPRVENGESTLCSRSCVGRIRYLGVMLYDADAVAGVAAAPLASLYSAQLSVFLDPDDPEVRRTALEQGMAPNMLEAASRSPVRKLIADWRLALPLHPEFRTLPMVWYIPPASPLTNAAGQGQAPGAPDTPDGLDAPDALDVLDTMRIPLRYLANLLAAGDEAPVRASLAKLLAMRAHMRAHQFSGRDPAVLHTLADAPDVTGLLAKTGLTSAQALAMYELLALARYESRFVLPTTGLKPDADPFTRKGETGYELGGGL